MFEDDDIEGKSHEEITKMPVYKKAWEIMELGSKIGSTISKDDYDELDEAEGEMLESYAHHIIESSYTLPTKISGAESADIYDIRMENAALIRKATREILTSCSGLQLCGYQEDDFLQLLRNEIEEFRVLFAEWVKTFDEWDYTIDRWGLFNPPGVNYDDYDPDDDRPFNPDNLFD